MIAKGDRVIVTSDAGEEGATVESLSSPVADEAVWVTLQMDDRTRYSCPLSHVRPETPDTGRTAMKAFAISATIETKDDAGYTGMRQVPTFYLLANVQGLLTEAQACSVAADIIGNAANITAVATVIGES